MTRKKVLLLPGDGIGVEIAAAARAVLDCFRADVEISEGLIGGAAIDQDGVPLSDDTLARAKNADAVLMGAVGGPKWDTLPFARKPERGLLRLRKELGLFANLRPALVFDVLAEASTLKAEVVRGLDIMIVRELTGGIYFGEPRGVETLADGERRGVNTQVYTTSEIRRVARVAFTLAQARTGKVCSVDKANVMESCVLWREEVTRLQAEEFPDVGLSHMYADNCAMQLVRAPHQFDVIVTDNLFGDLLSDLAAMLTGSLGMLPSASLGAPGAPGLYEPVHGSAPDIAGRNLANPLAMILSAALMMRHSCGFPGIADRIEGAVRRVLEKGLRTADIAGPSQTPVSTQAMAAAVVAEVQETRAKPLVLPKI